MQEYAICDGELLLTFDGRVLEAFGTYTSGSGHYVPSVRFHVAQLNVKTEGPDRKGRYELRLTGLTRDTIVSAVVLEDDWLKLAPLFDALRAAGVPFEV